MAPFKAKLKAAQQAYVQNKYEDALEHCNSALQDNEESPDGLLYDLLPGRNKGFYECFVHRCQRQASRGTDHSACNMLQFLLAG